MSGCTYFCILHNTALISYIFLGFWQFVCRVIVVIFCTTGKMCVLLCNCVFVTGKSSTQLATKPVGTSKTAADSQPLSTTNMPVCHCTSSVAYIFCRYFLLWPVNAVITLKTDVIALKTDCLCRLCVIFFSSTVAFLLFFDWQDSLRYGGYSSVFE